MSGSMKKPSLRREELTTKDSIINFEECLMYKLYIPHHFETSIVLIKKSLNEEGVTCLPCLLTKIELFKIL